MTTPFAQINSHGGYIGRLAWLNTMDIQTVNPHCPVNVRFWGKGPFLLKGWGQRSDHPQHSRHHRSTGTWPAR